MFICNNLNRELTGVLIRYWPPLSFKKFFKAFKYLGRTSTSDTVMVYVHRHRIDLGEDV
jgi:hypothetical protein